MEPDFHMFGLSHWAALLVTAAAATGLILLYRRPAPDLQLRRCVEVTLAMILVVTVFLDPLLNCLRWSASGPERMWAEIKRDSLPMHFCDLVALLLAGALLTHRQRLAELGYLWGLSGTIQGLITPGLKYEWPSFEYFAFFLQHGSVPVAALGLAFGAGLKPQPGALLRTMLWSNVYLAVIFGLNALLGTNYGYLNGKPPQASVLDFLGDWPWYLLSLEGVALILYSLLLLPFRGSIVRESKSSG
jgi:hypothetical integral membrane protein (TIGR02206 family)